MATCTCCKRSEGGLLGICSMCVHYASIIKNITLDEMIIELMRLKYPKRDLILASDTEIEQAFKRETNNH